MFPALARSKASGILYQFINETTAYLLEKPSNAFSRHEVGDLVNNLVEYSAKSWWIYLTSPTTTEKIDLFQKKVTNVSGR